MRFNEIYEGLLQGKKYKTTNWTQYEYIYYDKENHMIKTESDEEYNLSTIQIMESDWVEHIDFTDYEKCIGCLCWLWNDKNVIHPLIGILSEIDEDTCYKFINQSGVSYKYCKPIKPEDIKFYNGEK